MTIIAILGIIKTPMEKKFLTRQYLETLSSADLMALADDYDIDVPADLNRRFVIGELLEIAEELNSAKDNEMIISSESVTEDSVELPKSYNETFMDVVLRNPAWAFVYWDISMENLLKLKKTSSLSVMLHVSFFEDKEEMKSDDSFDIQVALEDRQQYILIPFGKKYMRVDLIYSSDNHRVNVLASTRKIELIHGCKALFECAPGKELKFSPVMELSGMNDLLRIHYERHRQSFME